MRLAIPGLLMLCCEWWCYEISAFVLGAVSKTQLGIHTILMQVLSVNFMVRTCLLYLEHMHLIHAKQEVLYSHVTSHTLSCDLIFSHVTGHTLSCDLIFSHVTGHTMSCYLIFCSN